jgi:hypothetical protein
MDQTDEYARREAERQLIGRNASSNVCPRCDGSKKMIGMFPKYVEGHSGPPAIELDCPICSGQGTVSSDFEERSKRGAEFHRIRVDVLGLGLREAADLWGMKASELSNIETGRVDNSHFKVPGIDGTNA